MQSFKSTKRPGGGSRLIIPAFGRPKWEQVRGSPETRSFRAALTTQRACLYKEKKKKAGHRLCSQLLTTWEAEVGTRSLKSGWPRLLWAMVAPLHTSLGDKARPCHESNNKWMNEWMNKKMCRRIQKRSSRQGIQWPLEEPVNRHRSGL